jgi:TolB protein
MLGPGSDPNGFEVVIDRRTRSPFDGLGPLVFAPISSGDHVVELAGLSANCQVDSPSLRNVLVSERDTARVTFTVTCEGSGGTLQISVATTGTDLDPNGYMVTVDGAGLGEIDPDGTFSGTAPAGPHTIELGAMTPNCRAEGENPRTVGLPSQGYVALRFEVECSFADLAGPGHELAVIREVGNVSGLLLINDDGTGGRPLRASLDTSFQHPSWSPDGVHLVALASSGGLVVMDITSGETRGVDNTEEAMEPAWSPDGQQIAFARFVEESESTELFTINQDGLGLQQLTRGNRLSTAFDPAWSPDGREIVYVHSSSSQGTIALAVLTVGGETREVVTRDEFEGFNLFDPEWAPDGSAIAFVMSDSFGRHQIFLAPTSDHVPRQLTSGVEDNNDPTWSPDASRIGFISRRDGNRELYVMNADGTNPVRLTRTEESEHEPAWRP